MTTTAHRTAVFRSLPALLALVLAFFAAPANPAVTPVAQHTTVSAAATVAAPTSAAPASAAAASAVPATTGPAEVAAPPAEPVSGRPVTDRTRALSAQRSAGAAGSRAPPRTAA